MQMIAIIHHGVFFFGCRVGKMSAQFGSEWIMLSSDMVMGV